MIGSARRFSQNGQMRLFRQMLLFEQTLLFLALTAVLVAYFLIWLPGPSAGLQLMGLETGEWVKFMGMGTRRNLFYLPPITLALTMQLTAGFWDNGRYQTWIMRAAAIAVSLLAFPAIEDMMGASRAEYMSRLAAVFFVGGMGIVSAFASRHREAAWTGRLLLGGMALLGAAGFYLPLSAYVEVRPVVAAWMGMPIGIGIGVWLNSVGHLGITAVALFLFWAAQEK